MRGATPHCNGIAAVALVWTAFAGAQPIAAKPQIRAGDSWVHQTITEPGAESGSMSRTVEGILPGGRLRVKGGNGSIAYYDDVMNNVGPELTLDVRPLVRYPMKVDDSWSYARRFGVPGSEEQGTVNVTAFESITVPAGTFDCYRIEADYSMVTQGGHTRTLVVRWYCPAVKWMAKERVETRMSPRYGPGMTTVVRTAELVRFVAGP